MADVTTVGRSQEDNLETLLSLLTGKKLSRKKILKMYTSVGLFLYMTMLICKLKGREFKTMLETSAYFYNKNMTASLISLHHRFPRLVFCIMLKCNLKIKFHPLWL